jgi:hypothetical protein
MTQADFMSWIAQRLEAAGIPFMVVGSHASSMYGVYRGTNDVDIVIDPTPAQLTQLVETIADVVYVSPAAARDALRRRSMFNIIHFEESMKADLIVRKTRPFDREQFQRRRAGLLGGYPLPVASAEDVILAKLEWNHITPSDRQWQDAFNVAVVQWPKLEQAYLRHWAAELGIAKELDELLRQADQLQPPPLPEGRGADPA